MPRQRKLEAETKSRSVHPIRPNDGIGDDRCRRFERRRSGCGTREPLLDASEDRALTGERLALRHLARRDMPHRCGEVINAFRRSGALHGRRVAVAGGAVAVGGFARSRHRHDTGGAAFGDDERTRSRVLREDLHVRGRVETRTRVHAYACTRHHHRSGHHAIAGKERAVGAVVGGVHVRLRIVSLLAVHPAAVAAARHGCTRRGHHGRGDEGDDLVAHHFSPVLKVRPPNGPMPAPNVPPPAPIGVP